LNERSTNKYCSGFPPQVCENVVCFFLKKKNMCVNSSSVVMEYYNYNYEILLYLVNFKDVKSWWMWKWSWIS
jgi:hypothetical protein